MFELPLYFAIEANLVSFRNDNPDVYLLTFVAFVSGFSERFAPDVFRDVEAKGQPSGGSTAGTGQSSEGSTDRSRPH